jgi:DNA-binding phage protein
MATHVISPLTRSHEEATVERFRRTPNLAAQFLEAVLEDNDQDEIKQAHALLSKVFGAAG